MSSLISLKYNMKNKTVVCYNFAWRFKGLTYLTMCATYVSTPGNLRYGYVNSCRMFYAEQMFKAAQLLVFQIKNRFSYHYR